MEYQRILVGSPNRIQRVLRIGSHGIKTAVGIDRATGRSGCPTDKAISRHLEAASIQICAFSGLDDLLLHRAAAAVRMENNLVFLSAPNGVQRRGFGSHGVACLIDELNRAAGRGAPAEENVAGSGKGIGRERGGSVRVDLDRRLRAASVVCVKCERVLIRLPNSIQRNRVGRAHRERLLIGVLNRASRSLAPAKEGITCLGEKILGQIYRLVGINGHRAHRAGSAVGMEHQCVVVRNPDCIQRVLRVGSHGIKTAVGIDRVAARRGCPTAKRITFLCEQTGGKIFLFVRVDRLVGHGAVSTVCIKDDPIFLCTPNGIQMINRLLTNRIAAAIQNACGCSARSGGPSRKDVSRADKCVGSERRRGIDLHTLIVHSSVSAVCMEDNADHTANDLCVACAVPHRIPIGGNTQSSCQNDLLRAAPAVEDSGSNRRDGGGNGDRIDRRARIKRLCADGLDRLGNADGGDHIHAVKGLSADLNNGHSFNGLRNGDVGIDADVFRQRHGIIRVYAVLKSGFVDLILSDDVEAEVRGLEGDVAVCHRAIQLFCHTLIGNVINRNPGCRHIVRQGDPDGNRSVDIYVFLSNELNVIDFKAIRLL